jgi:hypothetical protein
MSNTLSSVAEDLTFFGQEVLYQLQNNLKLVPTVRRNYRGAEAAPGSHIQIPLVDVSGSASTRAVQGAATASDVSSSYVTVDMQQIYKAVTIDNLSRTFANVDLMSETAYRIAYLVAEKADSIVAALWNKVPYEAGSADGTGFFATTPDTDHLAEILKQLVANKAPTDNLSFVMNPSEALNLRKLASYKQAYFSGDGGEGRRTGDLKPIYGFKLFESQQIGNATLATTSQWGTPIASGGSAVGASTIALSGLGSGTIPAGSYLKHTASGQQYVVSATATISGNAATVTVFPKVRSTVTTSDAFTFTGHSAAGSMNLAYHQDAILAVARPSSAFAAGSGVTSVVAQDPQTGLGIRISHQSTLLGNPGMQEVIVADLVFGADVVRPEFIVKGTGQV